MLERYNPQVSWQQEAVVVRSLRLLDSFQRWTGYALIDTNAPPLLVAQRLFEADFVVVSHGTQAAPIFNYGNSKALELWQLDWEAFTSLPSRCSAEQGAQSERSHMLARAKNQGYISNFRGIRISSKGKRFCIEDGIIWNILDEEQRLCGQAATFSRWSAIA